MLAEGMVAGSRSSQDSTEVRWLVSVVIVLYVDPMGRRYSASGGTVRDEVMSTHFQFLGFSVMYCAMRPYSPPCSRITRSL